MTLGNCHVQKRPVMMFTMFSAVRDSDGEPRYVPRAVAIPVSDKVMEDLSKTLSPAEINSLADLTECIARAGGAVIHAAGKRGVKVPLKIPQFSYMDADALHTDEKRRKA